MKHANSLPANRCMIASAYARSTAAMAPAALLAALVAPAGTAQATGVSAGSLIENTATATYTSGTTDITVQSNTVTVKVDELLDVAVAGISGSPVAAGPTVAALPFSITNTGNGSEAFNLSVSPAVAGNQFDAVVGGLVLDDGDGIYEAGIDTVLATGAPTPAIDPDASVTIFVLVSLPNGASDGQTSQVRLTANAVTGSGTPGTAFAGQGAGGGDAVVGSTGASDADNGALVASTVTVTLVKSASIADPFGGSQPVPGAVVTYTLVASATGSGTASNLHVTDGIPAGTSYQPGTLALGGSPLSDATDADAGHAGASGIDVALGDLAGGSTGTVTFKVKIN